MGREEQTRKGTSRAPVMLAAANFVFGRGGGHAFGLFGAEGVNGAEVLVEHMAVEEQEGAEGLVLQPQLAPGALSRGCKSAFGVARQALRGLYCVTAPYI